MRRGAAPVARCDAGGGGGGRYKTCDTGGESTPVDAEPVRARRNGAPSSCVAVLRGGGAVVEGFAWGGCGEVEVPADGSPPSMIGTFWGVEQPAAAAALDRLPPTLSPPRLDAHANSIPPHSGEASPACDEPRSRSGLTAVGVVRGSVPPVHQGTTGGTYVPSKLWHPTGAFGMGRVVSQGSLVWEGGHAPSSVAIMDPSSSDMPAERLAGGRRVEGALGGEAEAAERLADGKTSVRRDGWFSGGVWPM